MLRSWPRHRKARRSALQRQKETDFAAAVLAIKWMDPTITATTMDAFRKSPVLWRDFLMSMLYGTAFALTTDEGTTIYPRQFWEKVSRALDLLGAETGAILVRSLGQWQTLPPGTAGTVLTSQGPAALPHWT
ncbi:MAG: hypothetical protein WAP47_09265 [Candidatus Rokuibacteriota bacterium]